MISCVISYIVVYHIVHYIICCIILYYIVLHRITFYCSIISYCTHSILVYVTLALVIQHNIIIMLYSITSYHTVFKLIVTVFKYSSVLNNLWKFILWYSILETRYSPSGWCLIMGCNLHESIP